MMFMALPEDVKNIQKELDAKAKERFPGLSVSDVAEWRSWTYIFSVAIRSMQLIVERFETWINSRLALPRPGTIGWYVDIAKRYQEGYDLGLLADGSLGYDLIDPSVRIISAVSVAEASGGVVVFKVAKMVEGELAALSPGELLRFRNYINLVKFVGTQTNVVSVASDELSYDIEVYFDPAVQLSIIEDRVRDALISFRNSLGFDGLIYKQKFLFALMSVPGVVTVKLVSLSARPSGGDFEDVEVLYTTASGYFNYHEDSNIVFVLANSI